MMTPAIEQLISSFASNLYTVVRAEMRAEVAAVLGDGGATVPASHRGPGRPPKSPFPLQLTALPLKKARKKGPIQLCPAPGCKERSAPVFAMLCKKHKDTPKTTVAKWREARRAKAKKAA
jgi:hypothetical protein